MGRMEKLMSNPMFRSLLIFSAFRAVYGIGILVVTWFLATSEETPFWFSIVFLMFSMVFSRVLFKFLKKMWSKDEPNPSLVSEGIIN